MGDSPHVPVLLDAVLESFSRCSEGYIVDCTLGYAGHSTAILSSYEALSIVGIDRDEEALAFSEQKLRNYPGRYSLYRGAFAQMIEEISERPVVGILADFGVSSLQLDKKERGFSFESETLDMRMDQGTSLTAYDVVNGYSQEQLQYIFRHYGEIPQAEKLAQEILRRRAHAPIQSGRSLSEIAKRVLYTGGKIHPATLMFQAIRIEVNDELGQIEGLLDALEAWKPSGAVVSLITFHSLEDRLVKHRFRAWAQRCICDPHLLRCNCGNNHALGEVVTRKPVTAEQKERSSNPRSRSAKLRTFRFKEAE